MSRKIQCLNLGYVTLIDFMPSNSSAEGRIAQAARISFDGKGSSSDSSLVRYLYEMGHTSPLEMVEFMFEIYCPQFVSTHLIRHRTANINELSQRYTEVGDDMFYPSQDIRRQSKINKQCSVEDSSLSDEVYEDMVKMEKIIEEQLLPLYHSLCKKGVAKEVARSYLPRAMYTKMIYKMDANNLLKFLSLRCAPDAQKETRVFAEAMKTLVEPIIPTLIRCLKEREETIILRPDEIKAIREGVLEVEGSTRRTSELRDKIEILGGTPQ